MVGENGTPVTPEWSLPPRTTTTPEVTIATAQLDPLGSE